MLELLGVGVAALGMSGACPDAMEDPDRRWQVVVDFQPSAPIRPPRLIEIRTTFGDRELYVGGTRVGVGEEELRLLQILLKAPHDWSYDDVEQLVWPGQKVDLGERRRSLVRRVNKKLRRHLDDTPARQGKRRSPRASANLIRCVGGRVRLNTWALRTVGTV